MNSSFTKPFLGAAAKIGTMIKSRLASPRQLESLLRDFGWEHSPSDAEFASVIAELEMILSAIDSLNQEAERYLFKETLEDNEVQNLFELVRVLYSRLQSFNNLVNVGGQIGNPILISQMKDDLLPYITSEYLKLFCPHIYAFLRVMGVITFSEVHPQTLGRRKYRKYNLEWVQLFHFLVDPSNHYKSRYGFNSGSDFDYEALFYDISEIAEALDLRFEYLPIPTAVSNQFYSAGEVLEKNIQTLFIPIISGIDFGDNGLIKAGLGLSPVRRDVSVTSPIDGLLFYPVSIGDIPNTIYFGPNFSVQLSGVFSHHLSKGIVVSLDSAHVKTITNIAETKHSIALSYRPENPIVLVGNPEGSRIQISSAGVALETTEANGRSEVVVRVGTFAADANGNMEFIFYPSDGDNFLNHVFGNQPLKLAIDPTLTWSSRSGIGFNGSASLKYKSDSTHTLGPISVNNISMSLYKESGTNFALALTANLGAVLGAFLIDVDEVGLEFVLAEVPRGEGIFDTSDIKFNFKNPKGIGLSITSSTISGQGYLFLDYENHKYAGIANLKIQDTISVTAYGLINTRLPDNQPGFSFLLSVTAQFNPAIQLGLGFTLSGLGGLIGINRSADLDVLRAGVKSGLIDRILFPQVTISDFLPFLNQIDQAFPVDEHRQVFGLMAELNWGTPAIINLRLGIIIVVPDPVDIILLGVISVEPGKDESGSNPILVLKASFIGVYETDLGFISFDASLEGSRILNYSLSGDIIARLQLPRGKTSPDFLYSAGGFHPHYHAPASLKIPSSIERISLRISDTDNFRLIFRSYFALTPNTLQFGSRADLRAGVGHSFYVEGFASFDTFITFNPFALLADFSAELAVKSGGDEIMSLRMDGSLAGPTPWEVKGSVSFKIWFIRVNGRIDHTFGSGQGAVTYADYGDENTFLASKREGILNLDTNYQIVNPTTNRGLVSLAKSGSTLVPDGFIRFNQNTLPFKSAIYKDDKGLPFHYPFTLDLDSWEFHGSSQSSIPLNNAQHPAPVNQSFFVSSKYSKDADSLSLAARDAYSQAPSGYDFLLQNTSDHLTSLDFKQVALQYERAYYDNDGNRMSDEPLPYTPPDAARVRALLQSSAGLDNSLSLQNTAAEFVGVYQGQASRRYFLADPMTLEISTQFASGFDSILEAQEAFRVYGDQSPARRLEIYSDLDLAY